MSKALTLSIAFAFCLLLTPFIAIAQESPSITSATISGTTVIVNGRNLQGVTQVKVGDQTLTNVSVSTDGTIVTGSLSAPLSPGSYVVEVTLPAQSTCSSPQPGADWVCVNGGWVPPGHPLAAQAGSTTLRIDVTVSAAVAGDASTIYVSVYNTAPQTVAADSDVTFQNAASQPSGAAHLGANLQLLGNGVMRPFLVSWNVHVESSSCQLGIVVNGTRLEALTSARLNQQRDEIRVQAIVTMPDNASLSLRVLSPFGCALHGLGPNQPPYGSASSLTVLQIR